MADPEDLERFLDAQSAIYSTALGELRAGRKRSHWMWFVFPQLRGLGVSETSARFGIEGEPEARAYLAHPLLGPRLLECAQALIDLAGNPDAEEIFGELDALKLRSSMTLFASIAGPASPFSAVLERYFDGRPDPATVEILTA